MNDFTTIWEYDVIREHPLQVLEFESLRYVFYNWPAAS